MNFTHSGEKPISLDPRWLVESGVFDVDDRGLLARPFADDVSLLRIDFFDPEQVPIFFDGLCRMSSQDRKGAKRLQRVAPSMRLFEPGGTIDEDCRSIPEVLSFIAPLARSVPEPLRRLVGRFRNASDQWTVLDIFQQHLELGEKLPDQEAYVAEVLRLWMRHDLNVSLPELVKKVMTGKQLAVLQSFNPVVVKPKHVRALARLDPGLSSGGKLHYWSITRSDARFRALLHVSHIGEELLRDLDMVPQWIERVSPKIFRFADAEAVEHLSSLREYGDDGSPPSEDVLKVRSVGSKRDIMALGFKVEFPEPPVPGDDYLEPITDLKSLMRVGRELRNCAGDLADKVIGGASYFLLWKGKRRGLVQIGKDKNGTWKFVQAHGVRNSRLHRSTISTIKRRLKLMGI